MEEKKSTCKEGRKKTTVSIGGGGGCCIGGVVLWGGALAAATLIAAAFTLMKRNGGRKPANNHQQIISTTDMCKRLKKKNEDEGSEGLRSLLQTSSPSLHSNPCCRRDGKSEMDVTQIGSLELVSTQSLLLEEKPVLMLEINGEKETLLCDDEEIPDIEVKKENEACKTILAEQVEDDRTVHSGPEEDSDEDDDVGGYAVKKSEDRSEGMVDSSMESITEPIWPTESIEKLEKNFQNSGEKIDNTLSVEAIEVKQEDKVREIVCAEHVEEHPPKQSVEDDERRIVVEKGKESLEGMGYSLIESIAKPIWPTEPIERLKINFQNSNEKIEDVPSVEAIQVKKEDEACETVHAEQGEEDQPKHSVEDEVEDDDEGEIVVEKGKESLEGMGNSLTKSIAKPIWPTEPIERLKINFQNSGKKIEDAPSVEAIEVKKEDEICKTVHVEQIEEDPSMQLIEVEDEDDDNKGVYVVEKGEESIKETEDSLMESEEDPPLQSIEEDSDDEEGDYVIEKGEESSEGTEDSLMESNTELVWPTESIERLSLEFKEMKFNFQNSEKKIEKDMRVKTEDDSSHSSRENGDTYDLGNNNKQIARKSTTNSHKIRETSEFVTNSAKWRIWIWSVLVLVLLFLVLSLTHHEAMSQYLLNDDSFIVP